MQQEVAQVHVDNAVLESQEEGGDIKGGVGESQEEG